MNIPEDESFSAFALIADINGFAHMVNRSAGEVLVAQFTRDVLIGGVHEVEAAGRDVVAFMGDAFLAVLPNAEVAGRPSVPET